MPSSGRSCGRCVSSSRFAPEAWNASIASSAERCPRGRRRDRRAQRRLADEEVGVAGELGQAVARPGVARVGEHGPVRRRPEAERLERVVGDAVRRHLEARGGERLALRVLAQVERVLEHPRRPEPRPIVLSFSRPGGTQSSGLSTSLPGPNMAPQTHGTRSPQWSRWQCVITIASICGHGSRSRSCARTPGPQSSSSRRGRRPGSRTGRRRGSARRGSSRRRSA